MDKEIAAKAAKPKRTKRQHTELKLKVVQGPELTQEQVDDLARMLARMWLADFERKRSSEIAAKKTDATKVSSSKVETPSFDWTHE